MINNAKQQLVIDQFLGPKQQRDKAPRRDPHGMILAHPLAFILG